ncbi:MAG: hypothetical protein ACXWQ6_06780 [Candidatus Limnocylindrales bacterium]
MAAQPDLRTRPTRPFGVTVLALIAIFNVVWSLAGVAGFEPAQAGNAVALVGAAPYLLPALIGFAVAALVAAAGLWFLRPWGWPLMMLVAGTSLGFQLVMYWAGDFNPVRLLIWTVAAFYLNQQEVRAVFQRRPESEPAEP